MLRVIGFLSLFLFATQAAAVCPTTLSDCTSQPGYRSLSLNGGPLLLGNWATSAGRPTFPTTGMFGYNTTAGAPEWYNGSGWVGVVNQPPNVLWGIPGTWTARQNLQNLNGWVPAFGVADTSSGTPVSGGSGYNPLETIMLNDGCATHAVVALTILQSASSPVGANAFAISNRGSCLTLPANPVGQLSTSGSGTGATFNLTWGPIVSGMTVSGGVTNNAGNLIISTAAFWASYAGAETTVLGVHSGQLVKSGNYNNLFGHNAASGAGCAASIFADSVNAFGTDVLRNGCGESAVLAAGNAALGTYNQIGTAGNSYLYGTTAIGLSSMFYWNSPSGFPWNTALGMNSCRGASAGTVSFVNGTCIGTNTGLQLLGASNFLIMAGGGNGNVGSTTFASGSGVILVGSGRVVVDTPAAGSTNFLNIENAVYHITQAPTISSGFGSSPSVVNGASDAAFTINVGTGGAASAGVIAFGTAAPHGWACDVVDTTTSTATVFVTKSVPTSATTVTFTNYNTSGTAAAWVASDVLAAKCSGY